MKIVLVEDCVLFRQLIRKVCTNDFGYDVVGETDSGRVAVDLILSVHPDLVVLDLVLPDMDGFAVVEQVTRRNRAVRFMAISAYTDDYTLYRVEKAGIHGYIDKGTDTLEVLRLALSQLDSGGGFYSQCYVDARFVRQSGSHFSKILSDWECKILGFIGHGLSDAEIGERLQISAQTVQSHRSHILRKLNLKGTPKLIAFAVEHGFIHILSKTPDEFGVVPPEIGTL